jgi:transmembrane sensor
MARKLLKKELLNKMILGILTSEEEQELLETDEVKSMMYQQWTSHGELKSEKAPDFKNMFIRIKKKISLEKADYKPSSERLLRELEATNRKYIHLKKRQTFTMRFAAVIIILLTSALVTMQIINPTLKEYYTENIVPKGQKSKLILPDGTNAWLNSGTILRYSNKFGNKERNIDLEGEAYFEVTSNKKLPFIVNTTDIRIQVFGTSFNVMSYNDDKIVEITLKEGNVLIEVLSNNKKTYLKPGEKAIYHKDSDKLEIINVDARISTAWKENVLQFDNENFSEIISKLERWYDVDITVEGKDSIEDRFTMTIKTESLKEVLELIKRTTPIKYTIKERNVTIKY